MRAVLANLSGISCWDRSPGDRRRRLAPEDRRRQILAIAREILDSKPLEDITVEEAAQRAGVSAGLVFHYFGTQRKFRRALAGEAAQELLTQQEMAREEVVTLCETGCYRLVQALVTDSQRWHRVEEALAGKPALVTG